MCLVVRTKNDPHAMGDLVSRQVLAVDNKLFLSQARTLDELRAIPLTELRVESLSLGIFASLALILAAIGIYGAVSYAVAQRTRDIAVCKALGANEAALLKLLVGRLFKVALYGLGVGLTAALLITPRLSVSFSYVSAAGAP